MTLLKIRLRLVSIDLIYFNSSYSLEVKHYIQGESSFLGIYISFVKIKLNLYFYITLHIEPEDPVECKYSRFHSSLQVEEYFCFTRYVEPGGPPEATYPRFHTSLPVEEYFCCTR